jgi:hypothetical protein
MSLFWLVIIGTRSFHEFGCLTPRKYTKGEQIHAKIRQHKAGRKGIVIKDLTPVYVKFIKDFS